MYEWHVYVEGVGYIGTVMEDAEDLARLAAIWKYGAIDEDEDGVLLDERPAGDTSRKIFNDDEFSVRRR